MQRLLPFVLLILGFAPAAAAFVITPDPVPVARLVKSAEQYLKKNPTSAEAHYTLSRIHYIAFSHGLETLVGTVADGDRRPWIDDEPEDWRPPSLELARGERAAELAVKDLGPDWRRNWPEKAEAFRETYAWYRKNLEQQHWTPAESLSVVAMVAHATVAMRELEAALKLAPENPLYLLGRASLREQVLNWMAAQPRGKLSAEMRALTAQEVAEFYLHAFHVAYRTDQKLTKLSFVVRESLISYEAGSAFLRQSERNRGLFDENKFLSDALGEVKDALDKLDTLPYDNDNLKLVSPVVFALERVDSISALLTPERTVSFDLAGYGPASRWPWVKASTGFLVWDPERRGEITSGRQLFGNYTFQIFRSTGYEALAALDDDGDGFLRGSELEGIRVWFDANGNGRSDAGEVHDLVEFNITGIAVQALAIEDVHPTNPQGIIFGDGHTVPTWDWMAAPAKK